MTHDRSAAEGRTERRLRRKTLYLMTVLVAAAFVLLTAVPAAGRVFADDDADSRDDAITVPRYDVQVEVHKDHSAEFTENITVNYRTQRHGIYRYIPMSREYKIKNISAEGGDVHTSVVDGNRVIRIGSKNMLVSGTKQYTIRYTLAYYDDHNGSADELYLDLFPATWRSSVDHLTITMHVPDDLSWSGLHVYYGPYGSTNEAVGNWRYDSDDHRLTYEASEVPDHSGVTVKAELEDGYWTGAPRFRISALIHFLAGIAAIAVLVYARLKSGFRAPKVVETVEFYPPDEMSTVEVGYVLDGDCSERDITSLLFELAARGYIRIEPVDYEGNDLPEDPKLRKKARKCGNYRFTKLADPPANEKFLTRYMTILFGKDAKNKAPGTAVTLESLKNSIGKKYDTMKNAVLKEFSNEKRLYSKASEDSSATAVIAVCIASVVMLLTSYIADGTFQAETVTALILTGVYGFAAAASVPALISAFRERHSSKPLKTFGSVLFNAVVLLIVILYGAWQASDAFGTANRWVVIALYIVAALSMTGEEKRTPWSAEVFGKCLGFRGFIADAEAEKVNTLMAENENYCLEMIPYAYLFDLVDRWASTFRNVVPDESGMVTAFGITSASGLSSLSHEIDSISKDIASEVAETSKSFSGSDGGGSSGGGGGGGGGGSW